MGKLRGLSLFAGFGGIDLGLERTGGFETVAFCEISEFPRRVLAKHWPEVFIHDDVRTLTKETLCKGYAENALLNQLCRETGGNLASVRSAITSIKKAAGQKTLRDTTSAPLNVEEALSNIMAGSVPVAESASTRFWQSITHLITEVKNGPNTKALYGNSLSSEDFLTIIRFFVTTAIWQNRFTVPAHINELMKVPCYDDVRTLTAGRLADDGIAVDAIWGGFPCQDISPAGKGAGIDGERSSLWFQFDRLVGEIRPRVVIVENSGALPSRGLARVLGSLAARGYDAEWMPIPAACVGAPHWRDRTWIVAYPERGERGEEPYLRSLGRMGRLLEPMAWDRDWQDAFSEFRRLDHGIPRSVASTDGYRNAVVPQIPEIIGNAILHATTGGPHG